jgi:hypothetical protein
LNFLIAFRHTAIPIGYRTSAMIERDRALNEAGADEAAAEDRGKAMAEWMAQQHNNPLMKST